MQNKLTLLNTRPEPQNTALSHMLREKADIKVIQLPTIDIDYFSQKIIQAQILTDKTDIIIFTSVNAIPNGISCVERFKGNTMVIAIGKKTQSSLIALGWGGVLVPDVPSSEGVLNMPQLQQIADRKIMIFTGKNGRNLLQTILKARGASVTDIYCYQRVIPVQSRSNQPNDELLSNIDIVLITSVQCFENLRRLLAHKVNILFTSTKWLVYSNRIKNHLMSVLPEHAIIVCEPNDIAVLNAVKSLCKEK